MAKLYLLRHLKSQWNKENRFAGWVDNPLSDEGRAQAIAVSNIIAKESIDVVYSNTLIRCQETILRVYEHINGKYPLFLHLRGGKMKTWANFESGAQKEIPVPVYVSEKLNERYYGALQGLNKDDIAKKYGQEKVHLWRRGFDQRPPMGESLKDTYQRTVPFFKKYILPDLQKDKNVMVVASGNSLRAIVKYIEHISDEDMVKFELPFGALVQYNFTGGKFSKLAPDLQ